jgi:hypothetical protein
MGEYLFFDAGLRDRFVATVSGHGLPSSVRPDSMEGFIVEFPDDLPEETERAIDEEYEFLMVEEHRLIEEADEGAHSLMSVNVTLPDGRDVGVRIPAHYGRRLFQHFTMEEVQEMVSIIALGVFNPVEGPLCRKT